MTAAELVARREVLRATVQRRKASIRDAREALQAEAAALKAIEAECHRLGLGFVVVPPTPKRSLA